MSRKRSKYMGVKAKAPAWNKSAKKKNRGPQYGTFARKFQK